MLRHAYLSIIFPVDSNTSPFWKIQDNPTFQAGKCINLKAFEKFLPIKELGPQYGSGPPYWTFLFHATPQRTQRIYLECFTLRSWRRCVKMSGSVVVAISYGHLASRNSWGAALSGWSSWKEESLR